MRGFLIAASLLAFGCGSSSGQVTSHNDRDAGRPEHARCAKSGVESIQGEWSFAADLLRRLGTRDSNVILAPACLYDTLSILKEGAKGETELQIARVLRLGSAEVPADAIWERATGFSAQTGSNAGIQSAISLWGHQTLEFDPAFERNFHSRTGADRFRVDLAGSPDEARRRVNEWAFERTRGEVVQLLPQGSIGRESRIILASVISFHGRWAAPFSINQTRDADFHTADGRVVRIPLMQQAGQFRYAEDETCQFLELPYGERKAEGAPADLSMVVILPRKTTCDVERVLNGAGGETIEARLSRLKKRDVLVFLPRFKLGRQSFLAPSLAEMGMPSAFGSTADFSRMVRNDPKGLALSEIVHQATVQVDEEGTVAAGGTASVAIDLNSTENFPPIFKADHPFVFAIRDHSTGRCLFLGRVANPRGD